LLEPSEMKCPKCGAELPDEPSVKCPNCGTEIRFKEIVISPKKSKLRSYWWLWLIAIAVVIVLVLAVMLSPSMSPLSFVHDADADGHADSTDAFPNEKTQWQDTDGDGYGDSQDGVSPDKFPANPLEWNDTDGDGYGDNSDFLPLEGSQWLDSDGDGYGDNSSGWNGDAFPFNSQEWNDTDGDGYGDNSDIFPLNPNEHDDADHDGYGDNSDFYDAGNAKVKITILSYQGDGEADLLSYGDPFFIVALDTDGDGYVDFYDYSTTFQDTETLDHPFETTFDIPDNSTTIYLEVLVYDNDAFNDPEIMDYNPSSSSLKYIEQVLIPLFNGSWSYDGKLDQIAGEIDCELSYQIALVT